MSEARSAPSDQSAGYVRAREFFQDSFGLVSHGWWNPFRGPAALLLDAAYDTRLALGTRYKAAVTAAASHPIRSVLVVGVRVPSRSAMMDRVLERLSSRRHRVHHEIGEVGTRGKLENINLLLERVDASRFDWVLMTDDDMELPKGFLDLFIHLCEQTDLKLAMPAHRLRSYSGYAVTVREWGALVRRTNYVEVGPLTAFHREAAAKLLPLPVLRFGWGIDVHWPAVAKRNGWNIGVVDATPMRHLRPIGKSYDRAAATEEACRFLAGNEFLPRRETFSVLERFPA